MMKLYLIVYAAGQIVGTAGPLKECPKVPSYVSSRYEVRCEHHAKSPKLGLRQAGLRGSTLANFVVN